MKIAVEGCCHGELDAIYEEISKRELGLNGQKVDVLLICGDFQAIRNHRDLQCMAVPDKYKQLRTFYKYYVGEKVAPVLTIVIGGNHEASNYMWELHHGGWLAPNIYYLGSAGCVQVNGVRIAGASGIFKGYDFRTGFFEKVPYDRSTMRSVYHVREYSIRCLSLLTSPQLFLSHDWPQSIEQHGDTAGLLARKRHFRAEVAEGSLGSPPLMSLLNTLQPEWWFSAHLHVRFEARVNHAGGSGISEETAKGDNPDEIIIEDDEVNHEYDNKVTNDLLEEDSSGANIEGNPDEIMLDDEFEDVAKPPTPPPPPPAPHRPYTNFLALDKCLPGRKYLEIIDIDVPPNPDASTEQVATKLAFTYDHEWLAITRAFHPLLSTTRHQPAFPPEAAARSMVESSLAWINEHLGENPVEVEEYQKFVMTAPGPTKEEEKDRRQPPWYTNPQTVAFCEMLGVDNKINPPPAVHPGPITSSKEGQP